MSGGNETVLRVTDLTGGLGWISFPRDDVSKPSNRQTVETLKPFTNIGNNSL